MAPARGATPVSGWPVWGRPMGLLVLLLLGPSLLWSTPLSGLAVIWVTCVFLAFWCLLVALFIGAMVGSVSGVLGWVEWRVRLWVARFAPNPEALWLHWARHAYHPQMARRCLDRAAQSGGAEALFQEGIIFLEGGFGAGGQSAAVERLRKAAAMGHAEAAFRLAEALRTGLGSFLATAAEAELWYRRSATSFGPAAAWLAHAYQEGDGVAVDEAQTRHWSGISDRLRPHPDLSRSLLHHTSAPEDPLVRWFEMGVLALERGADRLVARRAGRYLLALAALSLALLVFGILASCFWTGSSALFHLPLLMMATPLLMLSWQAWRHWRERPRASRDRLREAAEAGDPEACFQLGLRHRAGGPHLPKDDLSAALWFRKAAEAGHPGAMRAMAEACLGGHGVIRDPREAARWTELCRASQLPDGVGR